MTEKILSKIAELQAILKQEREANNINRFDFQNAMISLEFLNSMFEPRKSLSEILDGEKIRK